MNRPVEPWTVRETELDLDELPVTSSLFTLSNGYLGVRGALDEGLLAGPGTLLAPVFEERPLTYPEPGFGYPERDERIVAVADAWSVRLAVDGEPFDVRTGRLDRHERVLDLRHGVLDRDVRWTSPAERTVEVRSRRFVSLARREVVAVSYEVRAVDAVDVALAAVAGCPHVPPVDRQAPDRWENPSLATECSHGTTRSWVLQRTATTGIGICVGADHAFEASPGVRLSRGGIGGPGHGASVEARLAAGQWLRLELLVAYHAEVDVTAHDLRPRVEAVLESAGAVGLAGLEQEHAEVLEEVWDRADIVVEGDDEMQQAARMAIFEVVQASARAHGHAIRAKGLTGTGYDGHAFWEAECHVLPVLEHVLPEAAAEHLRWRRATLDVALGRARRLGLPGAAFPWRTITGRECSGYWPAGTAAYHVSADVADAAVRHLIASQDESFGREVAVDIVVQVARLWLGLGHHGADGGFRIDGVTGPDEYSAVADNNTYTNLMVRRTLRAAVLLTERFSEQAADLGVDDAERGRWTDAAEAMVVPFAADLGVTEQAEGFTRHARWDFDRTGADGYPLAGRAPYDQLYRRQVIKQADLVLALHRVGEEFSPAQKRRDFDYYEALTVRDSSLSASTQAVVAMEVGHLDLGYAYARETALVDLQDLRRSVRDGLHVGALAGAWTSLVAGVGGLRLTDDGGLRFAPCLPSRLTRLRFGLLGGGAQVVVDVRREEATYRLVRGDVLELSHHGRPVRLVPEEPVVTLGIARPAPTSEPAQPPGRAPLA